MDRPQKAFVRILRLSIAPAVLVGLLVLNGDQAAEAYVRSPGAGEAGGDHQEGEVTLNPPQQVNVLNLPQPSGPGEPSEAVEIDSPLAPAPPAPGGAAPQANVVDSSSSPPVVSSVTFEGLSRADSPVALEPPDAQVAVGPTHVMEMVNTVGRISARTGAAVSTFALKDFFPGTLGTPQPIAFDPRVLYDALSSRWFAIAVSFDRSYPVPFEGRLHLAVSATSDPFQWAVYGVHYSGRFPDYPGIGVTNDKVTVSSNLFAIGGGFQGEQTIVLKKADLLAGVAPRAFFFAERADRFTVRPAQNLSSGVDQYLVMRGFSASPGGYCGAALATTVKLIRITGVPGSAPVTEASAVNLTMQTQKNPPGLMKQAPPPGIDFLDSQIDCKLLDAAWRDGRLWTSGTTGCIHQGDPVERACAHLIEVITGTNTVNQDIIFGAPGDYYIYPAVRSDISGDLYVSMSRTNGSIYPEARVAGRRFTDQPNTMTGSALVRGGERSYNGSRWGDYLGAAVDPRFPDCVWLAGEYSKNLSGLGNWGTRIAATSYSGGCDSDNDGWSDLAESSFIGTDPLDACADDASDGAWPPDIDNDTFVDTSDIAFLSSSFGLAVPGQAPVRYDVGEPASGFIDTADIGRLTSIFGQACGP